MSRKRGILRHFAAGRGFYSVCLSAAIGFTACANTPRSYDESYERLIEYKTQIADMNRRLLPVFEELSYMFYDPAVKVNVGGTNVRAYNQPPTEVLAMLNRTKTSLDAHREMLAEAGHLEMLPEHQLDEAVRNVQRFLPDWPLNAAQWYAYLYSADASRPPRVYASELKTFYEAAEASRKDVAGRTAYPTRSESSLNGSLAASLFFALSMALQIPSGRFIERWYKRIAAQEDLAERKKRLRTRLH